MNISLSLFLNRLFQYKNNIVIYYKMSLNPNSSETTFASEAPCAKFSLNINAFNGNTTNFNRCPAPKSLPFPIQPKTNPTFGSFGSMTAGFVRPL